MPVEGPCMLTLLVGCRACSWEVDCRHSEPATLDRCPREEDRKNLLSNVTQWNPTEYCQQGPKLTSKKPKGPSTGCHWHGYLLSMVSWSQDFTLHNWQTDSCTLSIVFTLHIESKRAQSNHWDILPWYLMDKEAVALLVEEGYGPHQCQGGYGPLHLPSIGHLLWGAPAHLQAMGEWEHQHTVCWAAQAAGIQWLAVHNVDFWTSCRRWWLASKSTLCYAVLSNIKWLRSPNPFLFLGPSLH